jgi:hypothetical protein
VVKQLILIPIYWGEWWAPTRTNAYSWSDVNGAAAAVVGGRYMDGLSQYGIGRGAVSKTYLCRVDPPAGSFSPSSVHRMLWTAIDSGYVAKPDEFDLQAQQPFYSVIVQPGAGAPAETARAAYHFEFSYDYGDGREPWIAQACWVRGDATAVGTVCRWVQEMAEACTEGHGDISDRCQGRPPVLVDRVNVPQYWSVLDNACWPPPDAPPVPQRGQHAVDQETQVELDTQFERQFQEARRLEGPGGLHRLPEDS